MSIPFKFGLSPAEPAITAESVLWRQLLPASRRDVGRCPANGSDAPGGLTYGDYFDAARDFLEKDNAALLRSALIRCADKNTAAELERVAVYLVKHGAFYHPAYVVVDAAGRRFAFVLNVAVSEAGRMVLSEEFSHLDRLNREMPDPFWPEVYGWGHGLAPDGRALPMFLGRWLEGFHEFHLTMPADHGNPQVVVWDTDRGRRVLSSDQVGELLRQAASILAYACHPLTLEAIHDWHHAAGDFVVAQGSSNLEVRLITVRRYAPLVNDSLPDAVTLLDALMHYLTEISLRLRLDRLDGIGAPVCHSTEALTDICRGFFEGLDRAAAARGLPDDFARTVRSYFALHPKTEWSALTRTVAGNLPAAAEERAVINGMIEPHAAVLSQILAES